jgi:hypothetical protein
MVSSQALRLLSSKLRIAAFVVVQSIESQGVPGGVRDATWLTRGRVLVVRRWWYGVGGMVLVVWCCGVVFVMEVEVAESSTATCFRAHTASPSPLPTLPRHATTPRGSLRIPGGHAYPELRHNYVNSLRIWGQPFVSFSFLDLKLSTVDDTIFSEELDRSTRTIQYTWESSLCALRCIKRICFGDQAGV